MTQADQVRPVLGRVTGDTDVEVEEQVTSTEIIEPLFDPYLGWPDPDVDDERPQQPVPPQHASAPSGICYVPIGGATLDVLTKATDNDRDVAWLPASAASLPPGGVATDVLTKQSATQGDATWQQPLQEVFVGTADPAAAHPQIDLWYDTTNTPGMLKARVGGVWINVLAGGEVWIGSTDPIVATPSTELWYDTTTRDLKARVGNAWVVCANEVFVGTPDPYVTDPASKVELWWDTTFPVRALRARVGATWELVNGSEVEIGGLEPSVVNPYAELWCDISDAQKPVLKARVNNAWLSLAEVEVAATDPKLTDPTSGAQLWFDTSQNPGVLRARAGGVWRAVVMPGGVLPQLSYGMAPNPGVSGTYSRADHVHGTPAALVKPIDYGTVIGAKEYDLPVSSGESTALSRSDHQHGTPRSEVALGDTAPSTPKDLWVNTSVTPPILMGYIGGAYVEIGAAGETPPNEVQIGGPDPTVRFPEAELWYDTGALPEPTLKARVNGQWVATTTGSEVEIGPTDPYATNAASAAELWYNTAANVRALYMRENGKWVLATPSFGAVYPQLSFGMQSNPGVSTDASRADHRHGTPDEPPASEVEISNDDPLLLNPKAELWVDADEVYNPAAAADEVWVGPDDPRAAGGVQELWFNTTVTPPLLMAWDGTQWVLSSTAPSEMEIGATDPYTTNPASVSELWFDTTGLSATPPTIGVLRARVNNAWVPATGAGLIWRGMWNSATVYAQGDAVSYDQPSGPVIGTQVNPGVSAYECLAQTTIGAAPPPQDGNRWRLIVEAGEPGAKGEQGIPGLAWKGVWSAAGLYAVNDAVSYTTTIGLAPGVSSYRCIEAVVSAGLTPPTDTTHWTLVAEAGQQGPEGEMGAATLIIGDFGQSKGPADLPPTGLIPVDWDAPGNPLVAHQMVLGESLFYAPTAGAADPADGHMFQYVTTNSDPSGWLDIGDIKGQEGDPGVTWQGQWSDTQQYAVNDGVYYGGSSYRCVIAVLGGAPPDRNRNNWTLLAAGATYNGTTDLWVGPDAPPANPPPMPPTELWYDTDAVPAVPTHAMRAFWQPDVQYVPGDQVLWPETATDIRMANRDTIGEEPGRLGVNDAVNFPDVPAATLPIGLSAVLAAADYTTGVDVRLNMAGYAQAATWNGHFVTATNAGNLPVFSVAYVQVLPGTADPLTDVIRFSVLTQLAVPESVDVLLSEFDLVNRSWIRGTADATTNTLTLYDSSNGVDWTALGTPVVTTSPLLTAGVTAIHIGHDNDEPLNSYDGALAEVETFDFAGTPVSSWVAFTLSSNPDGPNYPDPPPAAGSEPPVGTGTSPITGETYAQVGQTTGFTWLADRYPAWKNVTSMVQWLTADETTTALPGEGITFANGVRLFEASSRLQLSSEAILKGRVYVDAVTHAHGTNGAAIDIRTKNGTTLARLNGIYNSDYQSDETGFALSHGCGGYGWLELFHTNVASPPEMYVNGKVNAGDVLDRSALATKTNVADLDAAAASQLIDALKPITYERVLPVPEDQTMTPPPFKRVGITVEDIENSGANIDGLVSHSGVNTETGEPLNPDDRGYSIPGLLAVAIAEIKSLRARVAELEAR